MYAVAVDDAGELRLWCRIKRAVQGDIYYLVPGFDPSANTHVSYHVSGRRHLKSYEWKHFAAGLQAPGAGFQGAVSVFAQAITDAWIIGSKPLNRREKFSQIFAIDKQLLTLGEPHTLTLDAVAAGGEALPGAWKEVVAQRRFDDAIPELLVTLWRGLLF